MRTKKKELSKTNVCLSERLSQFQNKLNEFENEIDGLKFFMEFFGVWDLTSKNENADLRIVFSVLNKNPALGKLMLKLGDQGADVAKIYDCISYTELDGLKKKKHPAFVSMFQHAELHPEFNNIINQAGTVQKDFIKRIKALRGAVKLIYSLKPINISAVVELNKKCPDFNERLLALQGEVEELTNLYIKYAPSFSSKTATLSGFFSQNLAIPLSRLSIPKKTTSKSKFWNAYIVTIVDELKRIGFSDRQAYRNTMELFNLAFPEIWTDSDPDLIRQRYTYHKKLKNNKSFSA